MLVVVVAEVVACHPAKLVLGAWWWCVQLAVVYRLWWPSQPGSRTVMMRIT
jgi:hypothetical protein